VIIDHAAIKREYDKIKAKNSAIRRMRQEEVYKRIPRILEIKKEISKSGRSLTRRMLTGEKITEADTIAMEQQAKKLMQERLFLLTEHNYPTDYLDEIYDCNICNDEGTVGQRKKWCKCYLKRMTEQLVEKSNMSGTLSKENFDTFDLGVFSNALDADHDVSPREFMKARFKRAHEYVGSFEKNRENLLLVGPTGTGKTFLTHCIAEDLIRRGFLVVYFTAIGVLNKIKEASFDKSYEAKQMVKMMHQADLLIIDDLGTEMTTDFSVSELFGIINDRLIQPGKATLISTNLTPDDIQDRYSERLSSRILGKADIWEFFGEDLRIAMKLKEYEDGV